MRVHANAAVSAFESCPQMQERKLVILQLDILYQKWSEGCAQALGQPSGLLLCQALAV